MSGPPQPASSSSRIPSSSWDSLEVGRGCGAQVKNLHRSECRLLPRSRFGAFSPSPSRRRFRSTAGTSQSERASCSDGASCRAVHRALRPDRPAAQDSSASAHAASTSMQWTIAPWTMGEADACSARRRRRNQHASANPRPHLRAHRRRRLHPCLLPCLLPSRWRRLRPESTTPARS